MAENYQRSVGTPKSYKEDKGNIPAQSGPFIGEVVNNVDATRTGRLQVYLEYQAGPDKNDASLRRTVSYISPFYGFTQQSAPQPTGPGSFVGNNQSYGFWGTPPDLGTKVICFFVDGDPNQGYYLGMPIEPGINHMLPAIGASEKYVDDSGSPLFAGKKKLPVVEINNSNLAIAENPRFFDEEKPVHSILAGQMLSQGVIADPLIGPITSNSQRESPSTCFGISTPGRPIYSGGLTDEQFQAKVQAGTLQDNEANVISRRGGHTLVMDDGNQSNEDNLIRLRTSGGHQIMMNDTPDGQTIHIMHSNGQAWVELGKEGTIDVYAANSLNIRSAGEINMHADRSINLNAENGTINMHAKAAMSLESASLSLTGKNSLLAYSKTMIGLKSDSALMLKSNTGSWGAGSNLTLEAGCIKLNSGGASDVPKAQAIPKRRLPDTKFDPAVGWVPEPSAIETIVTRAPTHEPYAERGTGVNTTTNLAGANSEEVPLDEKTQEAVDKTETTEITKIEKGDYEAQNSATQNVGKLGPSKVTGMLAQSSKLVPQSFNEISNSIGVGKFGFSAPELEDAGFLKPGTADFFLKDATSDLNTVLSSSSVWSGNQGINGVSDFLNNESIQDLTKTDLFTKGLNSLQNAGVVTGLENDADLAGLVTGASKFGVDAVKKWTQGSAVLGSIPNGANSTKITAQQMNELVAGGKYAVNLTQQKISSEIQGFTTGFTGVTGTVLRTEIDSAVETVIANQKVTGIET